MKRTNLPIGIDSFEKVRRKKLYYVDKTYLISEILNNDDEVNLFTRPRRFGKTLTMSMLKCFFEIGTDKSLFDGLAISKEKDLCEQHMGKYPVISISLKEVDGLTFESAYNQLRRIIREEAFRLKVLESSPNISDDELISYRKIIKQQDDVTDISSSLKMLSNLLEKHYGQKVIVLIDEYDVPLDKAYLKGYYSQMIEVIRSLLSSVLKTNDSLYFGVLTGCLKVSKESIFTGLNNLTVHTISDESYDEYFGFTDEEVKKMLSDYNLESHYEEMKQWYDGYLFGDQEIYCPWDVIKYCNDLVRLKHPKPKAYWINSSGNDMVRKLIELTNDGTTRNEIQSLINGETITKSINEQLTHSEIYANTNNIWSLLYMTGYLTVTQLPEDDEYTLKIPNKEILNIYRKQVLEWFSDKIKAEASQLFDLMKAFEIGDSKKIESDINKRLIQSVSYYDEKESFYHGFLLALLTNRSDWIVKSNSETGNGRADITVIQEDKQLGFVVEIKTVKQLDKIVEACNIALKQIEDKDYTAVLHTSGCKKILAYGISFCEKTCKVCIKEIA